MKTAVMNITPHLRLMTEKNGSDFFLTTGAPVSIKINDEMCRSIAPLWSLVWSSTSRTA
jgi:Tfp pilus assembly ATPase PilU